VVVYLHGFSNDREKFEPIVGAMYPNSLAFGMANALVSAEVGRLDEYEYMFQRWQNRGWIVIAPRWQVGYEFFTPWTWQENVESIVRSALAVCGGEADYKRMAIGGHSMGAVLALRLAADCPVFRAVALHDIQGFDFTPLLATPVEDVVAGGVPGGASFTTNRYDDFSGLRCVWTMPEKPDTQLLLLTAEDTWNIAWISGGFTPSGFVSDISGALIARAWHNTPFVANKHHLVVKGSGHRGAVETPIREVYLKYTDELFRKAFLSELYVPWWSNEVRVETNLPTPALFDWNERPSLGNMAWFGDKLNVNGLMLSCAQIMLDGRPHDP
jgi:pimeloyl-ACP methyl ester carboxylesterase